MGKVDLLDLKVSVAFAVSEVFETMLSLDVVVDGADPKTRVDGSRIVGTVSFAGDVTGSISVHVSEPFARLITAAMLGMETEEVQSREEVHDVIGEISNMVGGALKSRLSDSGLPCRLSIPTITSGCDFSIESRDWDRFERFAFVHGAHTGVVEVYLKEGI